MAVSALHFSAQRSFSSSLSTDDETGEARPFRSGYVNAECEEPVGVPAT